MSFGSSLLRTAYKLSGAKKAFALPEDELLKSHRKGEPRPRLLYADGP